MTTRQTGFTLIELMVTIAVLGILLSIAIPSFQNMLLGNRIAAQTNQLITALNYARSEAVKRGSPATVCSTTDGGVTCAGSTNWATGWLVFADADKDGTIDGGEAVLRVWPALGGGNTLNSGQQRVSFVSTGFATGFNTTFKLCDERGADEGRAITINAMGRTYLKKGAGSCS